MNEEHKQPHPLPEPSGSRRVSRLFGLFPLTLDSGHAADHTSNIFPSVLPALSSHLPISCQTATFPNISKVGGK